MAIKFKEGTTEKGWVLTINEGGNTDNVNTVKYPVNNVDTIVWRRPIALTIGSASNWSSYNLFRPGASNSSYTATRSTEPLAVDLNFTTTVSKPAINATNANYGKGVFYNDVIYCTGTPTSPYYYLTPGTNEWTPGGNKTLIADCTINWPTLYNSYKLYSSIPADGYWSRTIYYDSTGSGTGTATTEGSQVGPTAGSKVWLGVSLTQMHSICGSRFLPDTDAYYNNQSTLKYWRYNNGSSSSSTLSYSYYYHGSSSFPQASSPQVSSPVSLTISADNYITGYFMAVTGSIYVHGSGLSSNSYTSYWKPNNTTGFPEPFTSSSPLGLEHDWNASDGFYLGAVNNTTNYVCAFIRDNVGGCAVYDDDGEWELYSGTKLQSGAIYRKTHLASAFKTSPYYWDLSVTFATYHHVQVSLAGIYNACRTGETYFGPFNSYSQDESLKNFSFDGYVPDGETCCVTITGPYSSGTTQGPLYYNVCTGPTPTCQLTTATNDFTAHLYFYPTGDVQYSLVEASITWGEYTLIGTSYTQPYCGNISTRPNYSSSTNYHYQIFGIKAPDAVACSKMGVSFSARLWGASSSTSFSNVIQKGTNARYYYTGRTGYTSTNCVLTAAQFTDALGAHTFSFSKTIYYHALNNSNYINMGDLTYSWVTLTSSAVKVTAVPKSRTYTTVNRKYWIYSQSAVNTYGNSMIQDLYNYGQSMSVSLVANDFYDIISGTATTAPSNWNTTSGTATSATMLNDSWMTVPLSYTAFVYTANQYTYSSTSYAPTMVISYTTQTWSS